ncbi:cytochrome P450 [Mycobacterium sp. M1]|uniref:Cytochrome P450 n=1 Tax=Mycolicibacter acidiphilus TaxID=2835306 RepID=A0ABS5RMM2_9MYCO|nr:cytochrome P450 [Mycolicibacter acidiphilus]MBS9534819.1 cytochrome P450 [Mycolicibacter acidiphilus]
MPTDLLHPPPRAIAGALRAAVSELGRPVVVGTYRDLRRPRARRAPDAVSRSTFDPTLPRSIANPYPDFERIRRHPVVVNERLDVWMLGRYDDVHTAARDYQTFSSASGIMLRATPGPAMIVTDPPDHDRLRKVTQSMFSKKTVGSLTSEIRALAADGVSRLHGGAVVDMVPALTIPLPINVIAHLLGVPRDQWDQFRAVSDQFAEIFSPRSVREVLTLLRSALPAYLGYRSYVTTELRRRAGGSGTELLDRLCAAVGDGEISDAEAFFYAVLILVAGNETTTNLLGMLLMRLAQDPDLFAELRADRSLLPAAVEETARWGSPVQWVARTTTVDHPVGDTVIPRGARVVLFYASANRDPARFARPDDFDIHRPTVGHLAFGHGIHFCLGAHLARLEVITAVDHLLDHVDGLELAGPVRWGTTPSLQGPVSVPVRARPAT